MKFMHFAIKYRYNDILLKNINFIQTVCFAAITPVIVLYGVRDISVTLYNVSVMLSPALSK